MPQKRVEKRTYKDRAEYLKKAVAKRRQKLKQMVVEYKGGKCLVCGYKKYLGAFDLHHIDGSTKEFGLSMQGLTRSWEKTKVEADKCVLLCANCHREVHGGIASLPKLPPFALLNFFASICHTVFVTVILHSGVAQW